MSPREGVDTSSSTFIAERAPVAAAARTVVVQGHGLVKRFGTGTSAVDALRGST